MSDVLHCFHRISEQIDFVKEANRVSEEDFAVNFIKLPIPK